ncbi:Uma2 family endonuclease [Leptolyngbya sp. NK1-12]|uniref:Uma2 family endonuclease n=1 Tax=Leptolyngbya sp. NK1-12 TaxID=2547451 RepID=A0AA96WPL8_9CYAN|nr:Uma2 family endonuclease [Leptolyngbya sp. NK1-12]WNZ26216.1 Uma2 family endonuclease [Leptolyngbya sp. NK1-12]
MAFTTAKWTIADYHQMIAVGLLQDRRVELLAGDIVEMAPEGEPHAYYSDEAAEYLIYLLGERAKVRQGKPITLWQHQSEPQPDIAIVQRLGADYLDHHPYPENIFWLIEYSDSSLSKDLEAKAKIYAAVGIPEYWVINLRTMQLIVFRSPTPAGYLSHQVWTQPQICPLAFPDISISVNRLLG